MQSTHSVQAFCRSTLVVFVNMYSINGMNAEKDVLL